jgi:hypothetical protein
MFEVGQTITYEAVPYGGNMETTHSATILEVDGDTLKVCADYFHGTFMKYITGAIREISTQNDTIEII